VSRPASGDPFQTLGLERRVDVTDDEVRAAWRRVAAATHPDRGDGGDPARFTAAAAAYTALRTRSGRVEVLSEDGERLTRRWRIPLAGLLPAGVLPGLSRVTSGRPVRLTLRVMVVAGVAVAAVATTGWQPATPALIAGGLTWLALTGRRDLGPR
jgi:alkaline phosphatase